MRDHHITSIPARARSKAAASRFAGAVSRSTICLGDHRRRASRRASLFALEHAARRAIVPGRSRGRTARRSRIDERAGRDGLSCRSARPGRPASIRSTTRCSIARATCSSPTAARAGRRRRSRSSASRRPARASRSPRASSTRRRWRSARTGSSTCRAASRARSIASTTTARTSRWRRISASRAAWRSTPTAAMYVGDRSGTIFRVARRARRRRSRRCRRASRRFTWR